MRVILRPAQLARLPPAFMAEVMAKGEPVDQTLRMDQSKYDSIRRKHGLSVGLGDSVAKLTKAIGLKPCPQCGKRQAKLNALVPY